MTTKPPLDKKALEAAAKASWDAGYADDRPTSAWEDFNALDVPQDDTDGKIAADHRKATTLSINAYLDTADLVPRSSVELDGMGWTAATQLQTERDEARAQIAALREALEQMGKEAAENTKRHHQPTIGYFFMAGVAETVPKLLTDTAEAARGYQLVDDEHVVMPMEPTNRILEYLYGPFISASSHQSRIDAYKTAMQLTPTATPPDPEDA